MEPEPKAFSGSKQKLLRAKKHIAELHGEVEDYLSTSPVILAWEATQWQERFSIIHSTDEDLVALVARIKVPPPERLAPIIGDLIHNLRSALDLMIFELVFSANPTIDPQRVCFPFWDTPGKAAEALDRSQVRKAGKRIVELVEAWEPFRDGRSRLHALHKLNVIDKHRTIVPIISGIEYSLSGAMVGHELGPGQFIDPFPAREIVYDGRIRAVAAKVVGPPIGAEVSCTPELAIDGHPQSKGTVCYTHLVGNLTSFRLFSTASQTT